MKTMNFLISKAPDVAIAGGVIASGAVQESSSEALLVSALTALIGYLVKELVGMAKRK